MKELIYAPIVVAALLGMLHDLTDLAENTQHKTIEYTDNMVDAIDCAFTAQALTVCSPDLFSYEYTEEIEHLEKISQNLEDYR